MTPPKLPAFDAARSYAVRAYLKRLALDSKPIVCGPFRSELGFEVLYWIPFLHWALRTSGISPERCIALSRGGMGALYPTKRAVDLYTLRSVDQVRVENQYDIEQRRILKQTSVTDWDRAVASEAADGKAHHLLHPSWMYWLLEGFWENRVTVAHVGRHCDFAPLPVPDLPSGLELPPKFCAVRFYERATLPLSEEVKAIACEIVEGFAQKAPVILLNQSLFADDHVDLPISGPNVLTLPQVPPEQNFLLQAAVLARAKAFVGTYGGVAQWALRYRRPSLSVYTTFQGTAHAHRMLSELLSAQTQIPFEVMDLKAYGIWKAALGAVQQELTAAPVPAPHGIDGVPV